MNRNIKFEYGFESVNGIVKKKYYLHEIPNIKEKCDFWNILPIVYVRQFTGLKDKIGVEIYEGDIFFIDRVKEKQENIGRVFFDNDFSAFVVNKTNGGWEFLHNFLDNNKTSFIGSNIHENPELL